MNCFEDLKNISDSIKKGETSKARNESIKEYIVFYGEEVVGEIGLDISNKRLVYITSKTENVLENPFCRKNNYNEVFQLFERRRLNKSRIRQYSNRIRRKSLDLWDEITFTHLTDYDDKVSVRPKGDHNNTPIIYGSKGVQVKAKTDSGDWLKKDYFGGEAYAEVIASRIAEVLGYSHADYWIEEDSTVCHSKNMLKDNEMLISFDRVVSSMYTILETEKLYKKLFRVGSPLEKIEKFIEFCIDTFNVRNEEVFIDNLKLDGLCMNHDRHLNNISFIVDNGVYRFAPIYDMGASFMTGKIDYPVRNISDEIKLLRKGFDIEPFGYNFRGAGKALVSDIKLKRDDIDFILNGLDNSNIVYKIAKMRLEEFI